MKLSVLVFAASCALLAACKKDAPAANQQIASPAPAPSHEPAQVRPAAAEWELLASELPSALLSVSGRSASDIFAVGADKGHGPFVLHFEGDKWTSLPTGHHGDLWWVQAMTQGPVLMSGADASILRYDGGHFESLKTPGHAGQTVYGVWGTSGDDFYAVGNAAGKDGFVWHSVKGTFVQEALPRDLGKPGFFKVWGNGADVWVVGTGGVVLHRHGAGPFVAVPSGTKETLFTISGVGDRVVTVGGSGNGVLLQGTEAATAQGASGVFRDGSPPGSGLLQGIAATADGDWASGERGMVYNRTKDAPGFTAVDHGLALPPSSSLHAIYADPSGGVWSVGGNVLTAALDDGMLIHYGAHVPTVTLDEPDN
jgi:hypothetical protein